MWKLTRREFAKLTAMGAGALMLPLDVRKLLAQSVPGGTLRPNEVSKFVLPLVKPPALEPRSNRRRDFYDVAVRQFNQRIISARVPETPIWSYGSVRHPGTAYEGGSFHYPSFTVEARHNRDTRVLWRNELVDKMGNYLPHLLPVDQTLHWANPPGGLADRDRRGTDPTRYTGPVPIVTHLHGGHTEEQSDGYPEAWYLPDANDIPAGYARTGTFWDYFNTKYGENWDPGTAMFRYMNDQPATTLWYHDHALGMTRLNVYAGPAGFWLIRGGPNDAELGFVAPGVGDDPFGEYTEIPIVIQDRSFNDDGTLFYPDNRAFFEGLRVNQLDIPFIPDDAFRGPSDVSPIWNPEFFGSMMVVNGRTWPYLEVEQRKYRFRFLNGCNSRFLILKTDNGMQFTQIGGDQGFLPQPVGLDALLMAPAERADVVMDFTNFRRGTEVTLLNLGPDEPFGGGIPGLDFDPADPESTGVVMQFRVKRATSPEAATVPNRLPAAPVNESTDRERDVSLNEEESKTVFVREEGGRIIFDPRGEAFGPTAALLGTVSRGGDGEPLTWSADITENPNLGTTEEWVIHNFTADAHPIHVHQVKFQVLEREDASGNRRRPEVWERGAAKDVVISYPGEKTRIKMHFDLSGYYVWHCHIVEHEDNEMMRPMHVGKIPNGGPQP